MAAFFVGCGFDAQGCAIRPIAEAVFANPRRVTGLSWFEPADTGRIIGFPHFLAALVQTHEFAR
jgi:hypothetical protein